MATCSVRWRSSGGRGEFEFVPAESLADRTINILIEALDITIPSEVFGIRAQGKPRLRKTESNNRDKLHLPQLVMALARLPEPAREDLTHAVSFPLENKLFVMDEMAFEIIDDDGITATLSPLRVSIRNSDFEINLDDRFNAIANDLANISAIAAKTPELASAVEAHGVAIAGGVNTSNLRKTANAVINLQSKMFGMTNAGSVVAIEKAAALPPTEFEADIKGKEGKLLTRIHVYKERDRAFAAKAKLFYKSKNGGKLTCEACGLDPVAKYGADGERCIEAHHKIPIEELQPDSVTSVADMAMVCASCHRIIHSTKPCLKIEQVLSAKAKVS